MEPSKASKVSRSLLGFTTYSFSPRGYYTENASIPGLALPAPPAAPPVHLEGIDADGGNKKT